MVAAQYAMYARGPPQPRHPTGAVGSGGTRAIAVMIVFCHAGRLIEAIWASVANTLRTTVLPQLSDPEARSSTIHQRSATR